MPTSTPKRDYDALLKQKLAAGLPLDDAKEVIQRQKEWDKQLDAQAAPAAPAPAAPDAADPDEADPAPAPSKGKKS